MEMAFPRSRNLPQLPATRRGAGPPTAASTASLPSLASRWVQVDDAELVRRLQRVRARRERLESADLAAGCWKWQCNQRGFSVYSRRCSSTRVRRGGGGGGGGGEGSSSSVEGEGDDDCCYEEVVATGTVDAAVDKLAAAFRSTNESDYNARMKALYASQFIYGSLVHVVAFPDRLSRSAADGSATSATQVSVKTCAFAKPRSPLALSLPLVGVRNEQWCLVEQFRRTPRGFTLEFSSVDAAAISLGKARPGYVDELLPVSGWLSVEQAAPSLPLRVVFRARIDPHVATGRVTRSASRKTTMARLLQLGKGLSRLDAVAAATSRPAAALTDKSHGNSHCISCTSRLRLAARLAGRQRQCQLCFYAACADCCRREQLVIYNRYAAELCVCHRCKESMRGGEYAHLQLLAAKRHGSHGSLALRSSVAAAAAAAAGVDGRTRSAVHV